jgi:hypothetical protein
VSRIRLERAKKAPLESGAEFATHGFACKGANPQRNVEPRLVSVSKNRRSGGMQDPKTSLENIGARLAITRRAFTLTRFQMAVQSRALEDLQAFLERAVAVLKKF